VQITKNVQAFIKCGHRITRTALALLHIKGLQAETTQISCVPTDKLEEFIHMVKMIAVQHFDVSR
jgi:hypothetical protein